MVTIRDESLIGQKIDCPKCKYRFVVEEPVDEEEDFEDEGKPEKKVKDQVTVPDKIEDLKNFGMHRHFTDAGCVLLFGGGIKKGYLHGKTADERPFKTVDKRVVIEDLHASIFHALGISPKLAYEIEQRPFYVTRDGLGKPITELFA